MNKLDDLLWMLFLNSPYKFYGLYKVKDALILSNINIYEQNVVRKFIFNIWNKLKGNFEKIPPVCL